jgi:hypothetical protein
MAMKAIRLWSNKGVALYPVDFPLVGQNEVFNALFKFKQAFTGSQANDIAGFFALIGDWGLGKTRIGYELFAQTLDQYHRWLLDPQEFIVPNGADGRLLRPQLGDGVLPLYVRYGQVCDDDLYASNWIARVANRALELLVGAKTGHDVPPELIRDLQTVLKAKGLDFAALAAALSQGDDHARLTAALQVLRQVGIQHLWVVVDEIETLGDLKRGLREDDHEAVAEDYLDMVSTVIKHENYRQAHPYVNFLVLCSSGMRDKIEIGPNRRRADSLELEPNRLGDVHLYVNSLRERAEAMGQTVDYPPGTLEGAFIACNRNFGWFNVMMSSIHESYRVALSQGQKPTAWQLIEEFARSEAQRKWIFDLSVLSLLNKAGGAPKPVMDRLVFGQLPVPLGDVTDAQAAALRKVEIPGRGSAFVELAEIHLDEGVLAAELVQPAVGFTLMPQGDRLRYYNNEISLSALLAALRAFSVGAEGGNFLVCRDLNAFAAQLSVLYERPNVDVAQIAEPLHQVFLRYQVADRRYLGPSFALLQQMDLLLKRETVTAAFLQDSRRDAELERYAQEVVKSERKRWAAICQGFARLLDESIVTDVPVTASIQAGAGVTVTSLFQSPRLEGLQVTPDGRVTVVYADSRNLEKLTQELSDWISQVGGHPIIVLLPSGTTAEDWTRLKLAQRVQLCSLPRGLTRIEETFLVKLSGRGTGQGAIFGVHDSLSARTLSTRGDMQQNWQGKSRQWRDAVEQAGYLIRPLWHSRSVVEEAFDRAYRLMLVTDGTIDSIAPDVNPNLGLDHGTHVQAKKACEANADPGPGQEPTLAVITRDEPYAPIISPVFGALLSELRISTSLDVLQRRFFFAGADRRNKSARHLEQVLNLLRNLGLVAMSKTTYRAVDRQTLKGYRETAGTWLTGECQALLTNLDDTFPSETQRLKKLGTSFMPKELDKVDEIITKADFAVLDQGGEALSANIATLVRQVADVEQQLQKVCPPGVYQQSGAIFECTPDQITNYEGRLTTLSLWQQVRFLAWLREQLRQRRQQLAHAINEQLGQAESLKTLTGQPFPVAPLTMPLKAILEEMNAPIAGGGLSSRGVIPASGYPQSVNNYLVVGQYADAWQRLDKLNDYVDRTRPTSFWARFDAARKRWQTRLQDYSHAQAAWDALSAFMGDVGSPAWSTSKATRAKLDQLRALVNGGLSQAVNAGADRGPEKLMDALIEEISAAEKFHDLPQEIVNLRQTIEAELKAIIDAPRVQALSKVLAAKRRSQPTVPPIATTYVETKEAYQAFNVQIAKTGRGYFEDAGKQTTFDQWQEVFWQLHDGRYIYKPEDEAMLRELEEMKLVERTVRLR